MSGCVRRRVLLSFGYPSLGTVALFSPDGGAVMYDVWDMMVLAGLGILLLLALALMRYASSPKSARLGEQDTAIIKRMLDVRHD